MIKYDSCSCKTSVIKELILSDQLHAFLGQHGMAFGYKMFLSRYKLLSSDICNFISLRSIIQDVHQFTLGHFLNGKLKHKQKCCTQ